MNKKLSAGNPELIKEIAIAFGPGKACISILLFIAEFINLYPGSLRQGEPASDTSTTLKPALSNLKISTILLSS